ncbi:MULTISPECIES: YdcF family protein [unclassified Nodularia (in: cyanobacteria)]|uniref:YdcF family protein n=1 Tax=unclassified Nodularia (in: cyanobacteria) TaxID=2656917 RepID=UPI00187EA5DA|nr:MULTISPECIES: YdcF family protein [unclassified Nodularia (in: cyanobacteria)]MBE9199425.1 YdcF family protein [Nodularia sp. LEGE 06071]MCC2692923.1 YdcF family protein [Nodularia sp. LEGE 04288]
MLKLNKKYGSLILAGLILGLFSMIPIRLAIAYYHSPHPQAILTLGGDPVREQFTAQFAQKNPQLDIWVSSGTSPKQALAIFQNADIANHRIHLDYRAVDTVTNFTSLVDDFKRQHIQHIYLVTSADHMPRAKTIATLVLGSQGIIFTPIPIPSQNPRESILRIVRDSGRSLLWIVSGHTGASFHPRFREPSYAAR